MANVAIVEAALRLDAKQFTKTIEQAKTSVQAFASDSRAVAAGVGAGLLSAAAGLGALAFSLKTSADAADAIGDSLAQAFTGTELDAVTKSVLELGAQGVFTEKQFEQVAKRVAAFGKDAQPALQRLADVASKTGAPLEALGEAYAKFGRDDKGTKALLKLTGIKADELVAFGGVLDSTGTKLDILGDNAQKNIDAFNKLADSDRFAGSMKAGTDGASQLAAEIKLLKQEIGAGLVTAFEDAGAAILPVAQYLRGFSDETKKFAGIGILVGAAVTGIIGLGLVFGSAAANIATAAVATGAFSAATAVAGTVATTVATAALPALTVAAGALVTVFNPLTLIVLGLAAAFQAYINNIDQATKASEELFQIEEKRAAAARTAEAFIGKSANELRDAGNTAKQVAEAADGLSDRAEAAFNAGNTALVDKLRAQITELRVVQRELSALEFADKEEKQIRADVVTALGPEIKGEAEARAKADDDYRAQREAEEDKARDAATAKEKEAHAARIKVKQDALNRGAKIVIAVDYEQAKSSEGLTAKLKAEEAQRVKDQQAAAATALATAKQNATDLEAAKSKGRGLKGQGLSNTVDDLQQNTEDTGADNSSKIKSALLEKLKLEQESIRLEADKEKASTQSAEARAEIERNAQLEIQQAYRDTAQELDSNLKQQADALQAFRDGQKKASSGLGDVLTLDQFFEQSKLGYGAGRDRAQSTAAASLPSLQSVIQPLPSTVSNNPSFDKIGLAADKLLAAAGKLSTAADKPTKVTVNTSGTGAASNKTTSVNGRMGAYEKAGRGIGGMVGAR
jgi:hypothetical protein